MMFSGSVLVVGMFVTWATPIWLISVGAALGLAVLGAAWGILYLLSRSAAAWVVDSVREGILLPVFYIALGLAAFAVAGLVLIPGLSYRELFNSVTRMSSVGPRTIEIEVPPATTNFPLDDLRLRTAEMNSFTAESDKPLAVQTNVLFGLGRNVNFRLTPGTPFQWVKPFVTEKERVIQDPITNWTATNANDTPAKLVIHAQTSIAFPQVEVVPGTALSLVALVAFYLLLRWAFPKVAAIALTTSKEAMAQPLFFVVLALGCFALFAFIFVPYNTFGEDVKMLKDSGLTLIMVLAMIVAVWSASVSVSEEVEGRTALTVLSKPVQRRQFVLGKFLGVLGPVVVLFVVLGLLFLVTVSFKVVYDAREVAKTEPPWQLCYMEVIRTVPGLVLAFLETVVLASISVAISTRLPMIANLLVCAAIYVLGNLVPMLVNSSVGKFEIVRFVGQFIATILPVLDHFNIQAAVAAGAAVPLSYLGMAVVYCALYSTIAMLLGLAMFEDRDLA
jgi:ABC-type transport system involved in multi-copper enzyme maturation permease subunit